MRKILVTLMLTSMIFAGCTSPEADSSNSLRDISLPETTEAAATTAAEKLYHVDLCGREFAYVEPKTEYHAGEEVKLHFDCVATDTDYSFFLDDESVELKVDYDGMNGFYLIFTMPEHDIKLDYESRNTMEPPLETYIEEQGSEDLPGNSAAEE